MTVYKYFLKLTNRYKIYGIIYLVIFMGMALLQISKIDERKHFEDVPVKIMIKEVSASLIFFMDMKNEKTTDFLFHSPR